jgi:hypothetical protein
MGRFKGCFGRANYVDFLQHDTAGMEREKEALMGKPGVEDQMLYLESDTAAYAGLAHHFTLVRSAIYD